MSSMTFLINDSATGGSTPVVQVSIAENADGSLSFTVTQLAGYVGDLRGLFFDVADESLIGSLTAAGIGLTEVQQGNDTVTDLGQGSNMQGLLGGDGGYDVGVEIGTSGIKTNDDFRSFTFTLDSSLRDLTLADFSNVSFGARVTSVGLDSNLDGTFETSRTGSSKTGEITFSVLSPMKDDATAFEDAAVTGNVLSNDGAGASDVLTVTGWSGGALGTPLSVAELHDATVTLNADGTYTIDASAADTLAAGQSVSHTFTYNVLQTNVDGTSTHTVSFKVTVTGTNDAPLVSVVDLAGAVTEAVAPSGNLTDTGTLAFTDVDLTDSHSIGAITASAGALGTLTASVTADTTGSGSGGVVTWDYSVAASAVEYLAAGETKTETFTFDVVDGNGGVVSRTVTVTVTGTNDAPLVSVADLAGAVTEAVAPSGNLTDTGTLAFTDVDLTDSHSIGAITASAGALGTLTASVTADTTGSGSGGVVTWDYSVAASAVEYLGAGQTKAENFTFDVLDGNGGVLSRTVTVTLTGTNDGPVVTSAPQSGAVKEDAVLSVSGQVTSTDVDNGATAAYSGNATGTYGSFVVDAATGEWTYTLANAAPGTQALAAGESVDEVFSVTVTDDQGATATQDVTITVTGTNDAPLVSVADLAGAVTEAVAPSGNLTDTGTLTFTDVDLTDSHSIGAITASAGALGTLTASVTADTTGSGSGGVVTWDYSVAASAVEYLAAGQTKVENFTFNVLDGQGGSVPRTVSVTLTGTNDAPVITTADTAGAVAAVAQEPQAAPAPLTFTVQQFLGYQSNDLNTLRNYATTHAANYTAQTNVIDYTDDPGGFAGELPGSYRWPAAEAQNVSGTGGINNVFFARITADFSVSAADTYTFRTFNDDGVFLLIDNTVVISDTGYHPEAPFQGSIALAPGNHTIELFFYENGGEASLEFSARNSTGTFGLVGANGGGLGGAISQVTDSGVITFSDVDLTDAHLVSATPIGGTLGTLTATKNSDTTGAGTGGQLTWSYAVANSAIAYLAEGETKVESFTITLNDQRGGVVTRQVNVTITGTNDGPVAVNDAYAAHEDAVLAVAAAGVLANDTDLDQGTLLGANAGTITSTLGATVVLNADGSFTYDARTATSLQALNDGQFADDTFSYTVSDGSGGSSSATVTLRVTGATDNRPPVAVGDSFTTNEDTTLTQNVLGNDADPDAGDVLSVVNAGTFVTAHGSVTLAANGQFTYTPAANYNGTDSFTYSIKDAAGVVSNTATVNLTVTPVNDAPSAVNDASATNEDTTLVLSAAALLANDNDVDGGDTKTLVSVQGAVNGTVAFNGTNVSFTPTANYNGAASYTYTMRDAAGATSTAKVNVTVNSVNDAPVLNSTLRGGSILFVDDDRGLNGQSTWLTALAAKGYSVDYEAIAANGDPVRNLTGYGAVIWSVGDQAYTNLTGENVSTLQAYLNSGGRLLYAGGHDLYDEPNVTAANFAQNYLGVNGYNYNMPYIGSGTPASGELGSVTLSPWSGGYYGGTMLSGFYANGGTSRTLLEFGNGNDIAAINSTSTFRAATWGFDLNQLDAPYRDNVLDKTLKALGIGLSTNEDTALSLAGLTVSDVDAATLSVTLSAAHGALSVTAAAGLTGLTGNGSASVTVTGSAAAVNQALAGLTYTPDANYNGTDALNVTVSDLGNSGSGGVLTASSSHAITVRPVSDTHVLSNLIVNGSFEQATSGWTVTGGGVDVVSSSGWQAGDRTYSLDLNAFDPGGVQQVLQTTPGVQYTVGFELSKNPGNQDHATVLVSAAGSSQSYTFSAANSTGNMLWSEQTFTFVATGTTTTLSFASTYPSGFGFPFNAQGPALDEVVVVSNKAISSFTKGAGGDVLQLSDVLTSVSAPHDGTAFSGGYLRFLQSGGDTLVQVDANGGGNSYLTLATLTNTLLTQTDTANYVL